MRTIILTIERRRPMAEALANELIRLRPEVFPGIDGSKEGLQKRVSKRIGRVLGRNEIACRAGHLEILRQFLDTGDETICVLEDDLCGEKQHIKIEDLKGIDDPYLWILGGQQGLDRFRLCYGRYYHEQVWEIEGLSTLFIHRSCCYVTNRSGARLLTSMHKEVFTVYDDWALFHQQGGRIFYSPLFEHPKNLYDSLLEAERKSVVNHHMRNFRLNCASFLLHVQLLYGKEKLHLVKNNLELQLKK